MGSREEGSSEGSRVAVLTAPQYVLTCVVAPKEVCSTASCGCGLVFPWHCWGFKHLSGVDGELPYGKATQGLRNLPISDGSTFLLPLSGVGGYLPESLVFIIYIFVDT